MMADVLCLNPTYSTTRLLTREKPVIESPPDSRLRTMLVLPSYPGRQGEGGLRTKGYFKQSLPDKPLISVITVVFNGEPNLEETIQSVINQTYDNVEYIIIDGGSTDGTVDIIRKYEGQIDYWVSERDEGIYDAMNKGWLLATCDAFILFINNGDLVIAIPNLKNLAADNVYVGSVKLAGGGKFNNKIDFRLHLGNTIHHQALLINNKISPKQPFNIRYKTYADFDFIQRLYKSKISFKLIDGLSTYSPPAIASKELNIFEMSIIVYHNYGFHWFLLSFMYLIYQLVKQFIIKRCRVEH
jgi:glycosyltransferase involved in cell wall biosynthesis